MLSVLAKVTIPGQTQECALLNFGQPCHPALLQHFRLASVVINLEDPYECCSD